MSASNPDANVFDHDSGCTRHWVSIETKSRSKVTRLSFQGDGLFFACLALTARNGRRTDRTAERSCAAVEEPGKPARPAVPT